jgi:hypothetical protein
MKHIERSPILRSETPKYFVASPVIGAKVIQRSWFTAAINI